MIPMGFPGVWTPLVIAESRRQSQQSRFADSAFVNRSVTTGLALFPISRPSLIPGRGEFPKYICLVNQPGLRANSGGQSGLDVVDWWGASGGPPQADGDCLCPMKSNREVPSYNPFTSGTRGGISTPWLKDNSVMLGRSALPRLSTRPEGAD